MKPYLSNVICRQRRESAAVLIIVLWIAIGLISIALYFANSMTYELRASDNRVSGLATEQAIEGAARYVSYALTTYSTNGAMPNNTQFACEAVPVGDAHFWLIGRDPSETPSSDPYFGLVDEASKLNLNTVTTNTLLYLPNMTEDFAYAIVDWRSTNGGGLYSMDYTSLGYADKNAPFETVDELRLVYGATMDLLQGNDLNHNGILDANEPTTVATTGGSSMGATTTSIGGNNGVQPGLLEYFTVYSKEPNFSTSATGSITLTNVNTASETELQTLFEAAGVGNAQTLAGAISTRTGGGRTFNGILDLCVFCKNNGMSSSDFAKIYPDVTTSAASYIRGRVNIDTADTTVLTALFVGVGSNMGVDQSTAASAAQSVINYRQQNTDNLNSVAWLVDALGTTSPVIRALQTGDYVTARSYQFTADIAAVGPFGRGYRRVRFVFDTSDGTPRIIYRQDLSSLGWALGEKVRQDWVVNAPKGN
jgi:DNA uptake protein ComE-like DNA-binding protein